MCDITWRVFGIVVPDSAPSYHKRKKKREKQESKDHTVSAICGKGLTQKKPEATLFSSLVIHKQLRLSRSDPAYSTQTLNNLIIEGGPTTSSLLGDICFGESRNGD